MLHESFKSRAEFDASADYVGIVREMASLNVPLYLDVRDPPSNDQS